MTTVEREIRARVDLFAEEIAESLARLAREAVADALAGRPRRGRVPPSRVVAGKAVSTDALLVEVRKGDGLRMEELARKLGTTTGSLKRAMAELIDTKKVKTAGQARGTRYKAT